MDYNILVLALILNRNDPEGTSFIANVSYYIDYALAISKAGVDFTATPEQVEAAAADYPHFASLTLTDLLSYS